jgi:hypothetical protein
MWTWIPFLYPRRSQLINKGFIYVVQKRTFEHVIFGLDCLKDLYQERMEFTTQSGDHTTRRPMGDCIGQTHKTEVYLMLSNKYSNFQLRFAGMNEPHLFSHTSIIGMSDISNIQPRFISSIRSSNISVLCDKLYGNNNY